MFGNQLKTDYADMFDAEADDSTDLRDITGLDKIHTVQNPHSAAAAAAASAAPVEDDGSDGYGAFLQSLQRPPRQGATSAATAAAATAAAATSSSKGGVKRGYSEVFDQVVIGERQPATRPKKPDQPALAEPTVALSGECTCQGAKQECLTCRVPMAYGTRIIAEEDATAAAKTGVRQRVTKMEKKGTQASLESNRLRAEVSAFAAELKAAGDVRLRTLDEAGRRAVVDLWAGEGERAAALPKPLADILKPHQIDGLRFMWKNMVMEPKRFGKGSGHTAGCVLAHSMGLGKTAQTVIQMHLMFQQGIIETAIILAPKSTLGNWEDEFKRWGTFMPGQVPLQTLYSARRGSAPVSEVRAWSQRKGPRVLLMTYNRYGILINAYGGAPSTRTHNELKAILQDPGVDLVVADEGHLLRNDKSALATAMTNLCTSRRLVLTGTPLQNNLTEYWTMVNFVRPNYFPRQGFVRYFQSPIVAGQKATATEGETKLMKQRAFILNKELESFVHRRDQRILMADLPPKSEYVVFLPLSEQQKEIYARLRRRVAPGENSNTRKEMGIGNGNFLSFVSLTTKLSAHPDLIHSFLQKKREESYENIDDEPVDYGWANGLFDEGTYTAGKAAASPKVMALLYIVEYCIKNRQKILVFSQYTSTLAMLKNIVGKITKDRNTFTLTGASTDQQRRDGITNFQAINNMFAIYFISLKAGGVGINLNTATQAVLFDVSFNPASDQQAMFRFYRYGQTRPCVIYRLVSEGTPESQIYYSCVSKEWMAKKVVNNDVPTRAFVRGTEISGVYEDLQKISETEYVGESEMQQRLKSETEYCIKQSTMLGRVSQQLGQRKLFIRRVVRHESLLLDDLAEATGEEEELAYSRYKSNNTVLEQAQAQSNPGQQEGFSAKGGDLISMIDNDHAADWNRLLAEHKES